MLISEATLLDPGNTNYAGESAFKPKLLELQSI
jgi:hypothetical protein